MPGFISNTVQVHIARYSPDEGIYQFLALQRSGRVSLYPFVWQVVTGTVEAGETALETALREVKEETGLTVQDIWTLPYVTFFFEPGQDLVHASPVFGVLAGLEAVIELSGEHRDYRWLSLEECLEMFPLPSHREGTKVFLENVLLKDDQSMFKVMI